MRRAIPVCISLFIILPTTLDADNFKNDFQNLLIWNNAGIVTMGFGLAGLAYPLDNRLVGQAEKVPLFEMTADPANVYGSSSFNLPVTCGLWFFSRLSRRPHLEAFSSDLLRALVWTQAIVFPIKLSTRRTRPDNSNRLSFPSGHTANAFAMAGVIDKHYGPKFGLPFYIWGALVGGARLEEDRHYLSDVIAGAAIGYVIGRAVSRNRTQKFMLIPTPISNGMGIMLTFRQ